MSEVAEETLADENLLETRGLTELLETLVPPKNIIIEDIYGNEYKVSSAVSARNQIKIIREFEKIQNMEEDVVVRLDDVQSIVTSLISVASNEFIFEILCTCFEFAHGRVVKKAEREAREEGDDYSHVGDLFAIEEIVAGIVPLFIRLARKTGKVIEALA